MKDSYADFNFSLLPNWIYIAIFLFNHSWFDLICAPFDKSSSPQGFQNNFGKPHPPARLDVTLKNYFYKCYIMGIVFGMSRFDKHFDRLEPRPLRLDPTMRDIGLKNVRSPK